MSDELLSQKQSTIPSSTSGEPSPHSTKGSNNLQQVEIGIVTVFVDRNEHEDVELQRQLRRQDVTGPPRDIAIDHIPLAVHHTEDTADGFMRGAGRQNSTSLLSTADIEKRKSPTTLRNRNSLTDALRSVVVQDIQGAPKSPVIGDEEENAAALHKTIPDPTNLLEVDSSDATMRRNSPSEALLVSLSIVPSLNNAMFRRTVDDAVIMKEVLQRYQSAQLESEQAIGDKGAADQDEESDASSGSDLVDIAQVEIDDDGDGVENSPKEKVPNTTRRPIVASLGDAFLGPLDLPVLDPHVRWDGPHTFRRRWWNQTYRNNKVENEFLRYELRHHKFTPLLIFAVALLVSVIAVASAVWVYNPSLAASFVWDAMLLFAGAAVVAIVLAMHLKRLNPADVKDAPTATESNVLAGGDDAFRPNTDAMQSPDDAWRVARRYRRAALRRARIAEYAALCVLATCVWGTAASYSVMSSICPHNAIFYVPWMTQCNVMLVNASNASAAVSQLNMDAINNRSSLPDPCPAVELYCQRAIFPFIVPALSTCIITFRPRSYLSVPVIMMAPVAYAVGRWLSQDPSDDARILGLKLAVVVAICIFCSGIKLAMEREQRRRFRAYAMLYSSLSDYVGRREALAAFLDSRIPPLYRARLLSGNLSLDYSSCATCLMLDIAEFPVWCTSVLPLGAASTVMQLHDVMTARCNMMGIEKVRSVGDVFYAASNLSIASDLHAPLCCQVALQIFSDAHEFRKVFAAPVALRAGMHSGKMLGAVIGAGYRRYEVFGEAMGTARNALDVADSNQIALTVSTAELAVDYVVTLDTTSSKPGSRKVPQRPVPVLTVSSPYTNALFQIKYLSSLKKMVPFNVVATATHLKQQIVESDGRINAQWASTHGRVADDARVEADESTPPVHDDAPSIVVDDVQARSPQLHRTAEVYQTRVTSTTHRATFEVLADGGQPQDERSSNSTTTTAATNQHEIRRASATSARIISTLRDLVVLNNSSTSMLQRAIADTRLRAHYCGIIKQFEKGLHEAEFTLTYVPTADRVPQVTSILCLVLVLVTMIVVSAIEHTLLDLPSLTASSPHVNSSSLNSSTGVTRLDSSRIAPNIVTGHVVLGAAIVVALFLAAIVWRSPNAISTQPVLVWVITCALHALCLFGGVAVAPSVVSSDLSYLFFILLVSLHFGSWSFSGLVMITTVSLGVFLAAVHSTEGSYLPIWTLPTLVVMSSLNMYFDRNREWRLRELYRDLFLTKAAAVAVQGEEDVRRSVLRATLPRPLFTLIADKSNAGKLLTTSMNESVVGQLRLDSLTLQLIDLLTVRCEEELARERKDDRQLPLAPTDSEANVTVRRPSGLELTNIAAFLTTTSPPRTTARGAPHGEVQTAQGAVPGTVVDALRSVHLGTSVIEDMLGSLVGTELGIVSIAGDVVTIAGPLEETDSRAAHSPEASPVSGDGVSNDQQDPGGELQLAKRLDQEGRVQRAAYDLMLLIGLLHKSQQEGALAASASLNSNSGERQSTLVFSGALVCDTIINVVANGEFPSYDMLGVAEYSSRALLRSTSVGACVATERFVAHFREELAQVERERMRPATVHQNTAASANDPNDHVNTDANNSSVTTESCEGGQGVLPPRTGEKERWRVRGLGTVWVHGIFPGWTSDPAPPLPTVL